MTTAVVLCAPPVLSVVRPSLALGILTALLREKLIPVHVVYANLDFANRHGLALNEKLAEALPAELLAGDWLFGDEIGVRPDVTAALGHCEQLSAAVGPDDWPSMRRIRSEAGAFINQLAQSILNEQPRLVGLTTTFQQTAAAIALSRRIKQLAPEVIVCLGGANCHGPMGRTLLEQFPDLDYVFTGEADESFVPFVEAVLSGGLPDGLFGIASRNRPALDARSARIEHVPMPDHGDYFRQLLTMPFAHKIKPAVTFEASRGCWWGQKHHCTFCGLNGADLHFRAKSTERVRQEVRTLASRHALSRLFATDNILAIEHARKLPEALLLDSNDYRIFFEIKSNHDYDTMRQLALAGVTWVQPGIESLDDGILTLMRKGVNALTNIRLLRNCRELGIGVIWSILYGFPDEPPAAYAAMSEILPALVHLAPPLSFARIRLDRFSPNFERASEMGFENVRPSPAYAALYGFEEPVLKRMAYFFDGTARGVGNCGYTSALRRGIETWRARWSDHDEQPTLKLEHIESASMVRDTRGLGHDTWQALDDLDVDILEAFSDPAPIEETLAAFGESAERAEKAFARMLGQHWILAQDDRALSLVVHAGRSVVPLAAQRDVPWGQVLPDDIRL